MSILWSCGVNCFITVFRIYSRDFMRLKLSQVFKEHNLGLEIFPIPYKPNAGLKIQICD